MEVVNNNIIMRGLEKPHVLHEKMGKMDVDEDDKALMEACREFEAIFLSMMFKEMNKTVPESGLVEKSLGTKIFEDMYIEEISNEISKQDSGLGIADMMYQQFKQGYVNW